MAIIGFDAWGINGFRSHSSPITNIGKLKLNNAIYDEVEIRERTEGIDLTSAKSTWGIDTLFLARFLNNLEAGNIDNSGITIEKFAIKRRKPNETNYTTLGYRDFINNATFTFEDYTQSSDKYIYSITPVGDNSLEGQENPVEIDASFTGWFLVDKDTNEVLEFDKFIDSAPSVQTTLNMNDVQIDTFSPFPRFYRMPQSYHTFSLSGVMLPNENEKSGDIYRNILEKYIYAHKPFLVKGGNGSVYVVKVSNPQTDTPQNTWKHYDYLNLTLDFTEIMTYEDYTVGD